MNFTPAERIARAVLYEGYILYPYRPSSVKNRQRWTFGGVYPQSYSEANENAGRWSVQTECLVDGTPEAALEVRVRFLHLQERLVGERRPDGPLGHPWQEAVEREVVLAGASLDQIVAGPRAVPFEFPSHSELETVHDSGGEEAGAILRRQWPVAGKVILSATQVEGLFRVRVEVQNLTPVSNSRDDANLHSLVSVHTILGVEGGEFISMIDPPASCAAAAAGCRNLGTWPVLVGAEEGQRGALVLSSPIVLPDFPRIAPESPGDLFDGTEIDEILTLRILTLTEDEKAELRGTDRRAGELLDRTEALTPDQLGQLHGTMRRIGSAPRQAPDTAVLQPGCRVRLRPHRQADAFDLVLRGKAATVATVERDFEGQVYVTVTVDDDPGKDLGLEGKPGHRFFFHADEVELFEGGAS
jgi:hypothetical protein